VKRIGQLLRGRVGWILRIVVTVGLFALLLYLVNLEDMVDALRQVLIGWLVVAAAVKMVGIFAAIVRWDLLLRAQGIRVPFLHLVGSFMVGRFIGMFLPSTIGLDAYRAYDIARHAKDAIGSVAVIVVEKVAGFFTLSLLVLMTLPAGRRFVPDAVLVVVGVVFCLPVALAFLLLLRPQLFEWILKWRFPGKARVEGKLREAIAAIGAYRDQRGYLWLAVLLGLVVHGATAWMYYFTARAVQAPASMADMLFVGPLIIVATLIGPVVAGLGAREGTAAVLLERIGAGASGALAGHLGFWTAEALPALIGGLVLALRPNTYRPAIQRARRPTPPESEPAPAAPADVEQMGPPPALWKDGVLPGLASGALGGLLVGVGEVIAVASGSSSSNLTALPYAALLYGGIGLLAGAGLGVLLYLAERFFRPANPAAATARWSVGLLLVGMGALVTRYRLIRDVFAEQLPTFSLMGILVHGGLLLGGIVLLVLILFLARRIQRTRAGLFLARGGSLTLVLLLVGGAFLAAIAARPVPGRASSASIPEALRDCPNVVLIGVDTLRADHLSCYGYPEQTSPRIDALAADGVLYRNMIAQSSWTKPSFATIFTSFYPSSHTAIHKASRLPQSAPTLAEELQAAGYATGGFADNINIAPSFGFNQGFDTYIFMEPSYPLGASAAASQLAFYQALRQVYFRLAGDDVTVQHFYQDAETMNAAALEWLGGHRDERFFLFIHYMDPHDPYMKHPYDGTGYARASDQNPDPAMAPTFSSLYDGEILYLDAHLGDLFDWLEQAGLYDDALIILTADHGEEFQEHGGWWHGQTLYGEQILVPLIVKYPGQARAGAVEEDWARSLDIAPTILDVAGLAIPPAWQGRSLWSPSEPPAYLFAEEEHEGNVIRMVQTGGFKLILANQDNPRGLPAQALFNLPPDPGEQHNLVREEAGWVSTLREVLKQAQAEALSQRLKADTGTLDAAAEEQLRRLGY